MNPESEPNSRVLLILLSVAAVICGFAAVLSAWHSMNLLNRVDAILFVVVAGMSPFRAISDHRSGRNPIGPYGGLIVGYVITILALTSLMQH